MHSREHAQTGFTILRRIRPHAEVANAVALQHHERQDGLGYPQGLVGTNTINRSRVGPGRILLDAEITAVADVYDVLGTDRPHRRAHSPEQGVVELARLAGGHLSQPIVDHLFSLLPVSPLGNQVSVRAGRYPDPCGTVVSFAASADRSPVVRLLDGRATVRPGAIEVERRVDSVSSAVFARGTLVGHALGIA